MQLRAIRVSIGTVHVAGGDILVDSAAIRVAGEVIRRCLELSAMVGTTILAAAWWDMTV